MKLAAMTALDALDRGVRRSHLGDRLMGKSDMISRAGDLTAGLRYHSVAKRVNAGALRDLDRGLGRHDFRAPRTVVHGSRSMMSSAMPDSNVKFAAGRQVLMGFARPPGIQGAGHAARKMKGMVSKVKGLIAPAETEALRTAHGAVPKMRREVITRAADTGKKLTGGMRASLRSQLPEEMGVAAAEAERDRVVRNRVLLGAGSLAAGAGIAAFTDAVQARKLKKLRPPLTEVDEPPSGKEEHLRGDSGDLTGHDFKHASDEEEAQAFISLLRRRGHRVSTSDTIRCNPGPGDLAGVPPERRRTVAEKVGSFIDTGPDTPSLRTVKPKVPKVPKPVGVKTEQPYVPKVAHLIPADLAGFLRGSYSKIATDVVQRFMRSARTNGLAHTVEDLEQAWRLGAATQPRTHNARFATVGTRLRHLGGKSGPAWSSLKKNVQSRLPMGTGIPGQKGPDALATLKR